MYEPCPTWDERVVKFFLCCHGEDICHNKVIKTVSATNNHCMNELLRFSLLPWKQCLPQQRCKQTIAIVPKDLCATYELCPTLKREL